MKAADYCVFQLLRRNYGDLLQGSHDVTGLGPSRPLHNKWPPVKSAPAVEFDLKIEARSQDLTFLDR